MWTVRHPSAFKTPAEEHNVTQRVCDAGLGVLVERTAKWLELATDYQMQTAENKASVIAHQICTEKRFSEMKCFGSFGNQTIDAQTLLALQYDLYQIHEQACDMAENIANGYSMDNLLSTTDVGSLNFQNYIETLDAVLDPLRDVRDTINRQDLHADLRNLTAGRNVADAANAADESDLWQNKANAAGIRRDQYASQIQDISWTIDELMAKMGVESNALIQAANDEMWRAQESLQCAIAAENPRPTKCDIVLAVASAAMDSHGRTCHHAAGGPRPICDASDRAIFSPPLQPSSCAVAPPPADGCNFAMTGFQVALQAAVGCPPSPFALDDLDACCDAHALCYSQCGSTQLFCDQEMRYCMQSSLPQGNLKKCGGAIDMISLLTQKKGCPRFTEAQALSLAGDTGSQCRNADEHHGCVSSCHQDHSCMQTAERVCEAIAGVAGVVSAISGKVRDTTLATAALTANPLAAAVAAGAGSFSVAAGAVEHIAEAAACALAVAEEVEAAGDEATETQTSEELQGQLCDLNAKTEATKQMVGTVTALASLNARLRNDTEIDPASIARIDMSFMKFDLMKDDVLSGLLSTAIPANQMSTGDYSYEGDIPQLLILIRNKLDQTRAYYQAALDKRANEQQRDLLRRRKGRALRLVQQTGDVSEHYRMAQSFLDAELRAGCHVAMQYVIQAVRAYEYFFLSDYPGRQQIIDGLRSEYKDGPEYYAIVSGHKGGLVERKNLEAGSQNGCGDLGWSRTTFNLTELPAAKQMFEETGKIKLSIPLPNMTSYYHVLLMDVQVYLVGFPEQGPDSSLNIDMTRDGNSDFLDREGKLRRFTHDVSNPPIRFTYNTQLCTPRSQSANADWASCADDVFIRPSPYGTWELKVRSVTNSNPVLSDAEVWRKLQEVTAVRFHFKLRSRALFPRPIGSREVFFANSGDNPGGEGILGVDSRDLPAGCV